MFKSGTSVGSSSTFSLIGFAENLSYILGSLWSSTICISSYGVYLFSFLPITLFLCFLSFLCFYSFFSLLSFFSFFSFLRSFCLWSYSFLYFRTFLSISAADVKFYSRSSDSRIFKLNILKLIIKEQSMHFF